MKSVVLATVMVFTILSTTVLAETFTAICWDDKTDYENIEFKEGTKFNVGMWITGQNLKGKTCERIKGSIPQNSSKKEIIKRINTAK
jgi:hypothetical protein